MKNVSKVEFEKKNEKLARGSTRAVYKSSQEILYSDNNAPEIRFIKHTTIGQIQGTTSLQNQPPQQQFPLLFLQHNQSAFIRLLVCCPALLHYFPHSSVVLSLILTEQPSCFRVCRRVWIWITKQRLVKT